VALAPSEPSVKGSGVSLAAIVLAAGASSRMGRPKALLEWRGQSFLRRVIALAETSSCAPIIAVEGAIRLPASELGSAVRIVHTTWSNGQLSSLQAGLTAVLDRIDHTTNNKHTAPGRAQTTIESLNTVSITGVMVLAIDRPRILPSTCQALAAAHRREPKAIWQPATETRRGHPIIYPSLLFAELLALPSTEGPRDWLRSPRIDAHRRYLQVTDAGIFENFDRPGDLTGLRNSSESG